MGHLILNIHSNPQIQQGLQFFLFAMIFLMFFYMLALCIYIEFCNVTIQFKSADCLSQTDCSFKYIFVFGRIIIVTLSVFFSNTGTLTSVRDIFIMIVAFLMILAHFSYIPFKNQVIQKLSGGLLLWYF